MANVDSEALARLALWARLCCAPIRRRWRWSGFDDAEWARLRALAATVERVVLLRLLAAEALASLCTSMLGAAIVFTLMVMLPASMFTLAIPASPMASGMLIAGIAVGAMASVPLIYRVAFKFAVRGGRSEVHLVQAGDAELVSKVARQNVWIVAVAAFFVGSMAFIFGLFSATLQPLTAEWGWVLYPLNFLLMVDFVVRTLRRPRSLKS